MAIVVHPSAFTDTDDTWPETVIVTGRDTGAIEAALDEAGARCMAVSEFGVEWTEERLAQGSPDDFTSFPHYWHVKAVVGGASLYIDCQGVVEPAQASTFIHVLVEELQRVGVDDAEVVARVRDDEW